MCRSLGSAESWSALSEARYYQRWGRERVPKTKCKTTRHLQGARSLRQSLLQKKQACNLLSSACRTGLSLPDLTGLVVTEELVTVDEVMPQWEPFADVAQDCCSCAAEVERCSVYAPPHVVIRDRLHFMVCCHARPRLLTARALHSSSTVFSRSHPRGTAT